MKSKTSLFSIAIFLSILIFLISCGQKEAEWKGTIEEVNGVTVVKNPKEPMFVEDVFSLEEELSIGEAEGREEYMFSDVPFIAVDDEERIYVVDFKEAHIKVFDRNGNYVKTIGKKGQGPGEIGRTNYVSITSENEIMVLDGGNRRLAFFTLEGEFLKNISTAKMFLMQAEIDSGGDIIGLHYVLGKENPRYELEKLDPELNHLHSLGSSPLPNFRRDGYDPFFPVLRWDVINGNQVVCGYAKEGYEIKIFDAEGKLIRRILKEYTPLEITQEDIADRTEGDPEELKTNMSIPKHHYPFRWMITDDEGRIFIWTWERVIDREGYYYDIFDSEGKHIVKTPLKTRPFVIKKKKLYTVEEDEEGYQFVKRYKITWKY